MMAVALLAGCAFPHKVTVAGPNLSRDALAFLDLKDATRGETIATLGPPNWESTNACVLLYLSQTVIHWDGQVALPDAYDASSSTVRTRLYPDDGNSNEKLHALFVAYNTNGLVRSHAVQTVYSRTMGTMEEMCARYAARNAKH